MTTAERITEILRALPPRSQQQLLDLAETLAGRQGNGTRDERLAAMQEAMSDPLFVADLDEISEDFCHVDLEEVAA